MKGMEGRPELSPAAARDVSSPAVVLEELSFPTVAIEALSVPAAVREQLGGCSSVWSEPKGRSMGASAFEELSVPIGGDSPSSRGSKPDS